MQLFRAKASAFGPVSVNADEKKASRPLKGSLYA
jgi:hypothetical protein